MNVQLYMWQRGTAALVVPLVVLHVAIIFYATRQGLTAADILARTRGSVLWGLIYGIFVVALSVHVAIGVRNILAEWSPLNGRAAGAFAVAFGALLMILGLRAVAAVVFP